MKDSVMFHEYWEKETELWDISLNESFRQTRERQQCPWCKVRAPRIEGHGHYECSKCGKNVDECCQGEVGVPHPKGHNG